MTAVSFLIKWVLILRANYECNLKLALSFSSRRFKCYWHAFHGNLSLTQTRTRSDTQRGSENKITSAIAIIIFKQYSEWIVKFNLQSEIVHFIFRWLNMIWSMFLGFWRKITKFLVNLECWIFYYLFLHM